MEAPVFKDVDLTAPVKFYTDSAVKRFEAEIIETKKGDSCGMGLDQESIENRTEQVNRSACEEGASKSIDNSIHSLQL